MWQEISHRNKIVPSGKTGGDLLLRILQKICHPERNEMESRDLRIVMTYNVKLVRRSFDSLRSLRMTKLLRFVHYFSG